MQNSAWPTPQDYNEAIQNPRVCFADAELREGKVDLNAIGLPKAASGTFASVYRVDTSNGVFAVRCFLTCRKDQQERYQKIRDFVMFDGLDCTVEFDYIEQGIKVGGRWYPIVKMPWMDGPTLESYISSNLYDRRKLESLTDSFYKLSMALELAGIAHGDLQHGNIIVNPKGLRLVDYDGFYVPELKGQLSLEFGHPNYQHPLRDDFHFDASIDNFSSWLIYGSLKAIALDPELFRDFEGGDDCILFKRVDLKAPESSPLFLSLHAHASEEIRRVGDLLKRMLWVPPHIVPPLDATPEQLALLPTERPSSWYSQVLSQFDEMEYSTAESSGRARLPDSARGHSRRASSKSVRKKAESFFDNMFKIASPGVWLSLRVRQADGLIEEGSFKEALATYLKVRELHARAFSRDRPLELCILLKLATCSGYLDAKSQRDNYCLLASHVASAYAKQMDPTRNFGATIGLKEFYQVLGEFLNSTSRSRETDFLASYSKLVDVCSLLVTSYGFQKVLINLLEFVISYLNTSAPESDELGLRECASNSLKFSGAWAQINRPRELIADYELCWKRQCALNELLTSRLGDPVLTLQHAITGRACQLTLPRSTDFIGQCILDLDVFKAAMQRSISSLGFVFAMNCVTPPLMDLAEKDPRSCAETAAWLWKEVVLTDDSRDMSTRLDWLGQFDLSIVWSCLDDHSVDMVVRRVTSDFASVRRKKLLTDLLRSCTRLGDPASHLTDCVVLKLVELLKRDWEKLTFVEASEWKQVIRGLASDNLEVQNFLYSYFKQSPFGEVESY